MKGVWERVETELLNVVGEDECDDDNDDANDEDRDDDDDDDDDRRLNPLALLPPLLCY